MLSAVYYIFPPLSGEIEPDDQQKASKGCDRRSQPHAHDPHPEDGAKEEAGRDPQRHRGEDGVDEGERRMPGGNVQPVDGEAQRHQQVVEAEGAKIFDATADHVGVIVKHLEDGLRKELHQHKDDVAAADRNQGPYPAGLDGAVPLPGADILGAHRGDGAAHGHGGHDGKAVEFAHDAHGGGRVDPAYGVDEGRDDQEGKAGDAVLDRGGQADLYDQGHLFLVELKRGWFEIEDEVIFHHIADTENHAERLGKDGRDSGAKGSHAKACY